MPLRWRLPIDSRYGTRHSAGEMTRNCTALSTTLALSVAAVALAACAGSHPFIRSGSEKSVDIGYSGDVGGTRSLAERHCAGFNRVPRLVDSSTDTAYYQCDPR